MRTFFFLSSVKRKKKHKKAPLSLDLTLKGPAMCKTDLVSVSQRPRKSWGECILFPLLFLLALIHFWTPALHTLDPLDVTNTQYSPAPLTDQHEQPKPDVCWLLTFMSFSFPSQHVEGQGPVFIFIFLQDAVNRWLNMPFSEEKKNSARLLHNTSEFKINVHDMEP